MRVLSHRGYWHEPDERNTEVAFRRSFEDGFGTETDVRDHNGELVIAHDMPRGAPIPLRRFLELVAETPGATLPLALNVKADGMARALAKEMEGCAQPWFVFDMSFPDLREQLNAGNPTYARVSEFEPLPEALADRLDGVWLDAFEDDWFDAGTVERLLERGLSVCVVSPELHGRDPRQVWRRLQPLARRPGLALCTDLPTHARAVFY